MPRAARLALGGMVFHVINRGVGRMRLFRNEQDYAAFEHILEETVDKRSMRVCAYCLMPNHWHLVLWPEGDSDLARFMQLLTVTHAARWQKHRRRVGYGHLYQGRYKSFPVETEDYYYQVVRYVERNALRAGLVKRAEQWRWNSLWRQYRGNAQQRRLLSQWPVPRSRRWCEYVNSVETEGELAALRRSVTRGTPFGSDAWRAHTAEELGLGATLRPRGRPRKRP